ncbi:hypothetical protein BC939DRAFT_513241 [Gamsiella multidivaricata]|uniref:uncharacterized protein n=1 Tax=Gamsiella multidivaricata TaxID=101098 RepID=UPI00221F825D|nr:uncharacterized protein BC939DRAFT_513241 [Gamsiella multidivaricata]KAI7815777.1 hypothetical protein BC939DRAFT_513241 [Gamsiella multidivaricata]
MSAQSTPTLPGAPGSADRADYLIKHYAHLNQVKSGTRTYRCVCARTSVSLKNVLSKLNPIVVARLTKGCAAFPGSVLTQPTQIQLSASARTADRNLTVSDLDPITESDGSLIYEDPSDHYQSSVLLSATPVPPSQVSSLFVGPSPNYDQYTSPAPGPTPSFGSTPNLPSNYFSASSPKFPLTKSGYTQGTPASQNSHPSTTGAVHRTPLPTSSRAFAPISSTPAST